MIYTNSITKSIYFENNQIVNNTFGKQDIVSFQYVETILSFTYNTLQHNIGRYVLHVDSFLSYPSSSSITFNIFDNYTPGTSSFVLTTREIFYGGFSQLSVDATLNYWGTNVTQTKGNSTAAINAIVYGKVYPSSSFKLIPYFITSDVNNRNSSNIGGNITAVSSSSHSQGKIPTDELIGIIVGSVGGTMLIIVVAVTIGALVAFIRFRKNIGL